MSSIFAITVTTIGKPVFEGTADSITAPGEEGEFMVLHNHESMLVKLQAGKVTIHSPEMRQIYQVDGGIVEIAGTNEKFGVRIIADYPTLMYKEGASGRREIER